MTVKNKAKQRGAGVKRTHFKKVKRRKEIRKLLISRDILNISACLLVGKRYFIPFLFQKTIMLIYMHGYIYIIMINVVKSRVFIGTHFLEILPADANLKEECYVCSVVV